MEIKQYNQIVYCGFFKAMSRYFTSLQNYIYYTPIIWQTINTPEYFCWRNCIFLKKLDREYEFVWRMSEYASTSFHFPLIWPVWPLRAVPLTSVFSLLTPLRQVIKEKSALPCTAQNVCVNVCACLEITKLFQGGKQWDVRRNWWKRINKVASKINSKYNKSK